MAVTVSYPQFEEALSSIGWGDPYPRELWGRLGGGESLTVERETIEQITASLGWTGEHAVRLWEAVEQAAPPLPAPPLDLPPAEPSEEDVPQAPLMPWERAAAPPAAEHQKKKAKASRRRPEFSFGQVDSSLALRRLAGSLVDGLVFLAALLAVCQLGKLPVAAAIGQEGPGDMKLQLGLVFVTVTAVMLLYFSWSMRRPASPGQSLGGQALSLRVVCDDGSPISPRQILLREGLGVVLVPWLCLWAANLLLWPAGLIVGAAFLASSVLGAGLADRLAKTKVIAA